MACNGGLPCVVAGGMHLQAAGRSSQEETEEQEETNICELCGPRRQWWRGGEN